MSLGNNPQDPRLILVLKKAPQIVSNSAVLVDDTELHQLLPCSVTGTHIYQWELYLSLISSGTADIRLNMVCPTTLEAGYIDAAGNWRAYGTNFFIACTGAAQHWWMKGFIHLAGGPDTLKFQWAQQVAEVYNTAITEGSNLRIWDLGEF